MSRRRTFHISALGHDVLQGLYAHRILATHQVRGLYAPAKSQRWSLATLAELERMALVERVGVAGERGLAWYLSGEGHEVAAAGGERRPYKMTPARAAGPQQAHTLAANEVGLVFVQAARDYGDECGPASWRNETAHRLGGARGETVIADALLEYALHDDSGAHYLHRFVEIDRATTSVLTLARKLEAYVRLYRHGVPYPSFPGLLVVMCSKDEAVLDRRIVALDHLVMSSSMVATSGLSVSVTTLDRLRRHGPHEEVWAQPGRAELVDLRGARVTA